MFTQYNFTITYFGKHMFTDVNFLIIETLHVFTHNHNYFVTLCCSYWHNSYVQQPLLFLHTRLV